jgi:hypothetical protein
VSEQVQHAYRILTYLLTYLLTYSLTHSLHGAGHYLKKLIVTQLFKKYPTFLWNPKVHYRVHTRPPVDPILSQLNPVRPIISCLPKVHLNVILPPTLRSYQWSLAFGPPDRNPVNTSPLLTQLSFSEACFVYYTNIFVHCPLSEVYLI